MAKRRSKIVIYLDILTALLEGPKLPTRVAQTCNLSYDNLVKFAAILEAMKLLERKPEEGHELLSITADGFKLQEEFRKNLLKLGVGLL